MGTVYKAIHTETKQAVALKLLSRSVRTTEETIQRFQRESQIAASINHPRSTFVYQAGQHQGQFYITMELMTGGTLTDVVRDKGPIPVDRAIDHVLDIISGLQSAHEAGIVHRDLKPSNCFLDQRGRVKIGDFGLAKSFIADSSLTQTGAFMGTPQYAAPEQLRSSDVDERTDIYALGVVMYRLITGELPFQGSTVYEIAALRLNRDPPLASGVVPGLSPRVDQAIRRCLDRDPELRFATAGEVVEAFLARTGESLPSVPESTLPAEHDSFVGRERECDELEAKLTGRSPDGSRPIVLIGPAGSGKTRLALHASWRSRELWTGGTWFTDLSEARSVEGMCAALAACFGIPLGKGDAVERLGQTIRGREKCLVVLDGFEGLTAYAPDTLRIWSEAAPDASFIVTSRERLSLGCDELQVEPLDEESGAALFTERARAHRPGYAPTEADHAAVRKIVQLVDGLPLAIELAAARIRVMAPQQIAARLEGHFRLLSGRPKDGRHASLKAAFDASWELLSEWERAAFAQCGVFEGGFSLEAAEAVVDLDDWPDAPWVVDVVQALIDKNLVRAWVPNIQTGRPRFRMLTSLKAYARSRLDTDEAVTAAERRHGRHFAKLGTDEALGALDLKGGVERRAALRLEDDNVVAACRRAIAWSAY